MASRRVEADDEGRETALSALTHDLPAPMIATLMTRGYGAASALENTESV
jgi:hypothetical protein